MRLCFFLLIIVGALWVITPHSVSAHEVYVLHPDTVARDIAHSNDIRFFTAAITPENLKLGVMVGTGIATALVVSLLFSLSAVGQRFDARLKKLTPWGSVIVRLALAIALFYSAYSHSFLGPELHLSSLLWPNVIRWLLFLSSLMLLFGVFAEVGALIGLFVFVLALFHDGSYVFTYTSYLGELILILLIGAPHASVDAWAGRSTPWRARIERYEPTILRLALGFAFIYTAINIKVFHAALTLDVVNQYNLTQYHLLFPPDPLLVIAGAAMTEITIGALLIVGFQIRLVTLVSLFYMTLSLVFFRESVWPHLILFGLLIQQFITNGGDLTLDEWLVKRMPRFHRD